MSPKNVVKLYNYSSYRNFWCTQDCAHTIS